MSSYRLPNSDILQTIPSVTSSFSHTPVASNPIASNVVCVKCSCCTAVFLDWNSLFTHVLQCSARSVSSTSSASVKNCTVTTTATATAERTATETSAVPTPNAVTTLARDAKSSTAKNSTAKRPGRKLAIRPAGVPLYSGTDGFVCTCGLSYNWYHNLLRHQRTTGCPTKEALKSEKTSKKCPYEGCGKVIRFERNYQSHIANHEKEELTLALHRSAIESKQSGPSTSSQSTKMVKADASRVIQVREDGSESCPKQFDVKQTASDSNLKTYVRDKGNEMFLLPPDDFQFEVELQ